MPTITNRKERIEIVNKILIEISKRGRNFFAHADRVAHFVMFNGKLYLRNEYTEKLIEFSGTRHDRVVGWTSGGTLLALSSDFAEFILHGPYTNHNNGYGGLYCKAWGYPAEDMHAIQNLAVELGYLPEPICVSDEAAGQKAIDELKKSFNNGN